MDKSNTNPEAALHLPLRDPGRSRAQMDTLRFGSIFLIMIHHFYFLQKPIGTIGTHFFFALTGFLVANSLMKLREQVLAGELSGWKAAFQFTTRRWMRILPVMWLMLTTVYLLFNKSDRSAMLWHYLLLSNIHTSITGFYPDYVAHLWWISAIEQTLPIFILLFMITPKHYLQKVLAAVILIGPAFRLIAYHYQWHYISMRVLPPAFIDIVGMGCLLAVAMKHKNDHLIKVIKWVGLCVGIPAMLAAVWYITKTENRISKSFIFDIGSTWAACWLIIVSYRGIGQLTLPKFEGWSLIPLVKYVARISYAWTVNAIGDTLAWPPLRYLGTIAYGLGMWHLMTMGLMMALIVKYSPKDSHPHLRAVGATFLAVIIASLSYRFIEMPISNMKHAGDKPARIKQPKPARLTDLSEIEDVELAK